MYEALKNLVDATAVAVAGGVSWFVNVVWNNPETTKYAISIAALVALFIFAYAMVLTLQWLYRKAMAGYRELRFRAKRAWHWVRKRPTSLRLKGKFMAKWKNGIVADAVEEAIFSLELKGVLSDAEGKRCRAKIAQALGVWDLVPRSKWTQAYLRHYFLGSKDKDGKLTPAIYESLAGPKKGATLPGAKPGEDVPVDTTNVVNSDMLRRIREKKQKVAA